MNFASFWQFLVVSQWDPTPPEFKNEVGWFFVLFQFNSIAFWCEQFSSSLGVVLSRDYMPVSSVFGDGVALEYKCKF